MKIFVPIIHLFDKNTSKDICMESCTAAVVKLEYLASKLLEQYNKSSDPDIKNKDDLLIPEPFSGNFTTFVNTACILNFLESTKLAFSELPIAG